ncbi:MAG: CbiX/SirB N-terminal domain-containing protein [Burkholderiaceae bacterium]|nr:CbiX/SirB N-terminal domain-containing protein [Burkholderiaceae bacterium]
MTQARRAIVFFCHGSRKPQWREPFDRLLAEFQRRCPDTPAALSFLELMTPGLPETIEAMVSQGARKVTVVPLFLAPGSHTRVDLPAMLDAARVRWPEVGFDAIESLTEDDQIRHAIVERAVGLSGSTRRDSEPS